MEINARNVNDALNTAMEKLPWEGLRVAPRGQETIELEHPVLTIYHRPQERVLFSPVRDANPFFHFFEPLWMLAGRNDVKFVAEMVKRMATFSDDGEVLHGAYGFRWRQWFGFDQIEEVIALLKRDPDTRRAVITMWSPSGDLVASEGAGGLSAKDVPCNTQIYLKVRDGVLRMTVTCRSNDIVWGLFGANATQFSVLQEYIAGRLGVRVGPLATLSDSFHAYTTGAGGDLWKKMVEQFERWGCVAINRYKPDQGAVKFTPMGVIDERWDRDMYRFFDAFDKRGVDGPGALQYETTWWKFAAAPMWRAWHGRDLNEAAGIICEDWRIEAMRWLEKRVERPEVVL